MWILLTLALAGSDPAQSLKPWTPLVQGGNRESKSWFQSGPKAFGSPLLLPRSGPPLAAASTASPPSMKCTIRVLKADPELDAKIARPAPEALDPKFVRPSPCQE